MPSDCRGDCVMLEFVGQIARAPSRRRAEHDHTAALTDRFASRQPRSLSRPVSAAAVFGTPLAELSVLQTGCRVPLVRRNHEQPVHRRTP
jgi:hypothetical protein